MEGLQPIDQQRKFHGVFNKIESKIAELQSSSPRDLPKRLSELETLATEMSSVSEEDTKAIENKDIDEIDTDTLLRIHKANEVVHHARHFIQAARSNLRSLETRV